MKPELKICGMKYNTEEVASIRPNYLGFIFYERSPRNFEGAAPSIPSEIKKVGVFVDAELGFITKKTNEFALDVVQLHGSESPEFCQSCRSVLHSSPRGIELWKVFSIKDEFDFSKLTPYEEIVDKFLFDTKGKEKGGNGYIFNWSVLEDYPSIKPFVLSGGIGLEELPDLKAILDTSLPIHAVDINSRFEQSPGLKDVVLLETFIRNIEQNIES